MVAWGLTRGQADPENEEAEALGRRGLLNWDLLALLEFEGRRKCIKVSHELDVSIVEETGLKLF